MKIKLVLHNIRSTYNVGAILRTAEGLGIDGVIYAGYTPRYNDTRLLPHLQAKLNRQIEKSALGAEALVTQETTEEIKSLLTNMKTTGWMIVGLENNLAESEKNRRLILGEQILQEQVVLVLGEEVHGIPTELRNICNYFLEIPMVGHKESFNVSVATAMALWELKRRDLTSL